MTFISAVCSLSNPAFLVRKPVAFIPAFPGTNCEIDTTRVLNRAGAVPKFITAFFRNPWLQLCEAGDIHNIAISHGEIRSVASGDEVNTLEGGMKYFK